VTINFDFSTDVIPLIIKEINSANVYIRIAIFQLHDEDVIKALSQKLPHVRVEIFTLPYDSINSDIRPKVEPLLRQLEKDGAKMYFDRWNIGDPSRTTTAVGRWYSFHGKFVITEKSAIVLSANLTQEPEIDAVIIFSNEQNRINEFNQQFDRLIDLFVTKQGAFEGTINERILKAKAGNTADIFGLPKNIGPEHENHWIRHYPEEICASIETISEKLYLTPFDCKGRNMFKSLIDDAEQFVYISTETFTDQEFSEYLIATAVNKKIEMVILTGGTSMDFTDRMENMLRDMLAHGIVVKITNQELHAKLLITDKALVVSSINLNKMNLGFSKTKRYWRESTESAFVCKNPDVLKTAREKFIGIANQGQKIETKLLTKLQITVGRNFARIFGLKSSPDAKKLIAKFILSKQLENRQVLTKLGKITKKLMEHSKRAKIERQDFISAVILYYLSERKQEYSAIRDKILEIDPAVNVDAAINALEFSGFVEKEGDYFKINVASLFS
jgi:hypothetical protein